MVAPSVKCYNEGDSAEFTDLVPINLGTADAGSTTEPIQVNIWNNKDGVSEVAKMENVRLTTVTANGFNSGDSVANGKEAVEQRFVGVKSLTNEDEEFTQVGGTNTKVLDDIRGDKLLAPTSLVGVVGHQSGGKVEPGTYYAKVSALDETGETLPSSESSGVTISAMVENTTEDADSEELSTTGVTRIAQRITSNSTYLNGSALKMKTGGNLVGTIRLETDNAGSPSGVLAHSNAELTNVTLSSNALKYMWLLLQATLSNSTDYWLVFVVTGGSGYLRGTTSGTANQVKVYSGGSWGLSTTIENLVFKVLDDNLIDWSWTEPVNVESYNLYRTTNSGTYGSSSLVEAGIEVGGTYKDLIETTSTGTPKTSATVTYGHKHEVELNLVVPSNATSGAVDMHCRVLYQYQ